MIQLYICMYIDVYIYILHHFHYRLLQDVEYIPLCYTVGPCWLSIIDIIACIF